MYGLLAFPCDTDVATPTRTALRGHTFNIHQQRCKIRRRQHAFSVRVVSYWNKLQEDIVNASAVETTVATGCTVEVALPRRPL